MMEETIRSLIWGGKILFKAAKLATGASVSVYNHLNQPKLSEVNVTSEAFDPVSLDTLYIRVPRTGKWNDTAATKLIEYVASIVGYGIFEIRGMKSQVQFRLSVLDLDRELIVNQVYSLFPSAEVVTTDDVDDFVGEAYRAVYAWRQGTIYPAPILTAQQVKEFDPLIPFTKSFDDLQDGEAITFTVFLLSDATGANEHGRSLITNSVVNMATYTSLEGIYAATILKRNGTDRVAKYEGDLQRPMEAKLVGSLWYTCVLTQVDSPDPQRTEDLMVSTMSHLLQYQNPGLNFLAPPENSSQIIRSQVASPEDSARSSSRAVVRGWLTSDSDAWKMYLSILSPTELAALWHLPYDGFTGTGIDWVSSPHIPVPKPLAGLATGMHIGINRYGGRETPVYLPLDALETHASIIGKNGTGKSSLMFQMMKAVVESGGSLILIDPHGSLVRMMLRYGIPRGREQDVVLLELSNYTNPMPFNLLARAEGVDSGVAAGLIQSVLSKVYADFAESQMAYLLQMALTTLSVAEAPTLLDVPRLFDDLAYRNSLVAKLDDFTVEKFWEDFDRKPRTQQEQWLFPLYRRLNGFYANKHLLAVSCHPQPLDLRSLMAQGKIILVSLAADEGKIPELERRLLGSSLVSQIQMAAMSGNTLHSRYGVFIDEAQHFVTTSLPVILSEARKSGLQLVLANQYFRQLAGDTFDAVEGNVGTMIAFEIGDADARSLASSFRPQFTVDNLVAQGRYRAAISLRMNGERLPSFSLETLPPPSVAGADEAAAIDREEAIRRHSVEQYTPLTYSEVHEWLRNRYRPQKPADGNGDDFIS